MGLAGNILLFERVTNLIGYVVCRSMQTLIGGKVGFLADNDVVRHFLRHSPWTAAGTPQVRQKA